MYVIQQWGMAALAYVVSCPDSLARAKRVWCSEQTFLVTWGRADLGFEITNQIAEDLIIIA